MILLIYFLILICSKPNNVLKYYIENINIYIFINLLLFMYMVIDNFIILYEHGLMRCLEKLVFVNNNNYSSCKCKYFYV